MKLQVCITSKNIPTKIQRRARIVCISPFIQIYFKIFLDFTSSIATKRWENSRLLIFPHELCPSSEKCSQNESYLYRNISNVISSLCILQVFPLKKEKVLSIKPESCYRWFLETSEFH